jgi:hypothetical protein
VERYVIALRESFRLHVRLEIEYTSAGSCKLLEFDNVKAVKGVVAHYY